jgi:hypothetical protein
MDLALIMLHGNVNMEGYKDIMTCCVLSMVDDQFGDDDYLYQHDTAPCQKARSVREWFVHNKVPEIEWRAQSPETGKCVTGKVGLQFPVGVRILLIT